MSDVETQDEVTSEEEAPAQEILIRITDSNVTYTSELALPEVVFWLDVVQAMLMNKIIGTEG